VSKTSAEFLFYVKIASKRCNNKTLICQALLHDDFFYLEQNGKGEFNVQGLKRNIYV